jgi:uncharacterized protein YbjT (DUF2867 family)
MQEDTMVEPGRQQSVLVTGGTGILGRLVVARLARTDHSIRVLSRRPHAADGDVEYVAGDLSTGEGIDAAVKGVEVVIHCAGGPKGDDEKARHLVAAATRTGTVHHLVYISVVGADRIPVVSGIDRAMFGYFAAKRAAEEIIIASGIPWSILRASQFHDLILVSAQQLTRLPIVPVPAFRFQPVDADEVAERLVELAAGSPAGLVPDLAGPETYRLADLLRSYLRAQHKHRILIPVRPPGRAARAYRAGANLAPERAVGHRTWEQFLAGHTGRPQ